MIHLLEAICQHTEGSQSSVQKYLWLFGQAAHWLLSEVMLMVAAAPVVNEVQCQCLTVH